MIVDEGTGRVQPNRRWNDNIHQAVEAKEGVEIKRENTTVASISYQCLFKLYDKLSGMTGTASTEAEELYTTYRLSVVTVPTHRRNERVDKPHAMFRTVAARWNAVADLIVSCHWEGRPVLGAPPRWSTASTSRPCRVQWQSQDASWQPGCPQAPQRPPAARGEGGGDCRSGGRAHAVTIATNMAGRGTDIVGGSPPRQALLERLFPSQRGHPRG